MIMIIDMIIIVIIIIMIIIDTIIIDVPHYAKRPHMTILIHGQAATARPTLLCNNDVISSVVLLEWACPASSRDHVTDRPMDATVTTPTRRPAQDIRPVATGSG